MSNKVARDFCLRLGEPVTKMRYNIQLISVVLVLVFQNFSFAHAAKLIEVKATVFDQWRSVLYRNASSANLLCAVETEQKEALFRVNHYKNSGDTFLEIRGQNWNMMEGDVRFGLEFYVKQEKYLMELKGRSWGTNYTHDILEEQNFQLLMGLLMESSEVKILNSNNTVLLGFSLRGSIQAITEFGSCIGD